MRIIRKKDRAEVMSFLKQVYTQENEEDARDVLDAFIDTYSNKYPKLKIL
ncbi:MAG: transposase [Clostridia bacterium]|nr:transposase [Clostridia bacterium]